MPLLPRLLGTLVLVAALPTPGPASGQAPAAPATPRAAQVPPAADEAPQLDVPYVPTPQAVVDEMLRLARPTKADLLYDLGCGDGRIVVTAAKQYGTKGVGFDIDPARLRESEANARAAGVLPLASFRRQDLFTVSLAEPSVLTMYLLPGVNMKLRPRILSETRPGTRVVSHAFLMEDWEPDERSSVAGANVFFWVVPANLSGTWTVSGLGHGRATLRFRQRFQKAAGALVEAAGAERALGDVVVDGPDVAFTVDAGDGGPARCRARVSGDRMEGTVEGAPGRKWSARRDPATKEPLDSPAAAASTPLN